MTKKRFISMLFAVALTMGLVPAMASAADPISTDVVIHKRDVAQGTSLQDHDGTDLGSSAPGAAMPGVVFTYWSISDSATDAQLSELRGLRTTAEVEAYIGANPGVLVGAGTDTAATDSDGTVTVAGLSEGRYLFSEKNGGSNNVTEYIGVPFLLELPQMKTDGTGYFGTGTNALHVYPKNAKTLPGLEVETVNSSNARIGSSSFEVHQKDSSGVWQPVTIPPSTSNTIVLPGGFITLADLPAGEYRLTHSVAPDGYLLDNRPIYFTVDSGAITFDGSANDKSSFTAKTSTTNDKITLELRNVPKPEKTAGGEPEKSFNIGDEVLYSVTFPIPEDIDTYVKYNMVDTIDTQLSWLGPDANLGHVTVKSGGVDVATSAYTKDITGQVLTLTFTPSALAAYAGTNLDITYKTFINDTAVMGEPINNEVKIDFNNGHGHEAETEPDVPPTVWTGGSKWLKVDGSNSGITLPGAEFKIATDAAGTTFVKWNAALIAANAGGSFATPAAGEDIVMVSDSTGKFQIKGLAGGTYYLVETKAPKHPTSGEQYNLLRDPAAFQVTKTSYEDTNQMEVKNNSGLQIPQTGGMGTVLFTIVGIALMGAAIVLFRKKRNAASVE